MFCVEGHDLRKALNVLFWICLVFLVPISTAIAESEISISSPSTEIVIGDPLFVNLVGTAPSQDQLAFDIFVNDKSLGLEIGALGGVPYWIQSESTGVCTFASMWALLCNNESGLVFDAEGTYKIRVALRDSENCSNELSISVSAPKESEEISPSDISLHVTSLIATSHLGKSSGEERTALMDMIRKAPNSRYTAYLQFVALWNWYAQNETAPRRSATADYSDWCEQADLFLEQFSLIEKLPSPSLWHARMLKALAHISALRGEKGKAISFAKRIYVEYGNSPFSSFADALLEDLGQQEK